MAQAYGMRPDTEFLVEQQYLQQRITDIERSMGRVAARHAEPVGISQPMDALDRARELVGDMLRQVRVRSLEDAIRAQLAWLDAAEQRLERRDGEPKIAFNRIELDRRLLGDILTGWRARRN